MNIRFNTDRETGLPHINKHGVNENEVEDVLLNPGETGQVMVIQKLPLVKRKVDATCK